MSKSASSRPASAQKGKPPARAKSRARDRSETTSVASEGNSLDEATRRAMIAEAAYYRAERRGFAPGFELEDWLLSENEVEAQIQSQTLERSALGSGEMH